jgi:hypothetical protein
MSDETPFSQENARRQSSPFLTEAAHRPAPSAAPAAALADPGAWQNPAMERVRQVTLGLAHAVAHPIETAGNVVQGVKSALTLPGDVATGKVNPMSDEGIRRAVGLAGMISPAPLSGKMVPATVASPTADALHAAANAGYERMRASGVDYAPAHVSAMASGVRQGLDQQGLIRKVVPQTHGVLDDLEHPPAGATAAPLGTGLAPARRVFGHIAGNFANPSEQLAAKSAKTGLDDFISAPPHGAVLSGNGMEAARALQDANGNYAAAMRSGQLFGRGGEDGVATGVADKAELNAATANSGANLDNAIRQRVKAILQSPKAAAGFNADELSALHEVARGTPTRNAVRMVGNLFGGGGGFGSVVTGLGSGAAGAAVGGPAMGALVGAGVPLAGMIMKKAGNALTSRSLESADKLVRQRSPLFQEMQRNAPPVAAPPEVGSALTRAYLASQLGGPKAAPSSGDLAVLLSARRPVNGR